MRWNGEHYFCPSNIFLVYVHARRHLWVLDGRGNSRAYVGKLDEFV